MLSFKTTAGACFALLLIALTAAPVWADKPADQAPPSDTSTTTTDTSATTTTDAAATETTQALTGGAMAPTVPSVDDPQTVVLPRTDVSYSGTFAWSFPLELPAGTNGVQPSLSLTYNSASPDGMLGMGFSLSGLGAIERDASRGINFASTDSYVLDGQKLYYQASDMTFHPEDESYDKIQAFLIASPTTPIANPSQSTSFWKVKKKDGSIYYYGDYDSSSWNDSTVAAIGKSTPRAWALSKVQDTNGNYYKISYFYDSATGAYYPTKVVYTLGNSLATTKTVQLSYQSTSDVVHQYAPTLINTDHRLTWVSVLAGTDASGGSASASLIRLYNLTYLPAPTTGRSRIASIVPYGTGATWPAAGYITSFSTAAAHLPTTTLAWQDSGDGKFGTASAQRVETTVADQSTFLDINGDGKADWVKYKSDGSQVIVSLSNGNTSFGQAATTTETDNPGRTTSFADINGDGRLDWIKSNSTSFIAFPYQNNGQFGAAVGPVTVSATTASTFVDVNGDGRQDWVGYSSTDVRVKLSNADGSWGSVQTTSNSSHGGTWVSTLGDYNGDGKVDWIESSAGAGDNAIFWPSKGDGTFGPEVVISGNLGADNSVVLFSDVNGDGKADWIRSRLDGLATNVRISKGDGNFEAEQGTSQSIANYRSTFQDVNGDGKTDWVKYDPNGLQALVLLSTGNGTFAAAATTNDSSTGRLPSFADISGDGNVDFLKESPDNQSVIILTANGSSPDLLTQINLPTGGSLAVTYVPAPQVAGAVAPTNSSYATGVANASPRALVTSLVTDDGTGTANDITATYQYANGLSLPGTPDKRKDLGFQSVTKIVGNAKTVSSFNQTPPLEGKPSDILIQDNATGVKAVEYVYSYQDRQDDPVNLAPVHFTVLSQTITKKWDGEATSDNTRVDTLLADHDAWGNLLTTRNYGRVNAAGDAIDASGALSEQAKVQNELTYGSNLSGDNYLFRVAVKKTTAYDQNGAWGVQEQTRYFYDGNNTQGTLGTAGLATTIESSIDATHVANTIIDYDAYGNVNRTWDPRYNSGEFGSPVYGTDTTATTKTTYDSTYHALVATITDALGHTQTTNYDSLLRVSSVVDNANNQTTSYSYDVFSRVTRIILPLDTSTNQTKKYIYSDPIVSGGILTTPGSIRTMQKTSATDTSAYLNVYTYYDGLGRTLQTKTQAVSGWNTTDYQYDTSGRRSSVSVPYNTSVATYTVRDTSQRTTGFAYDPLDRLVTTTNPDTTTRRVVYDQTATWQIDENNHAKVTYDYGNYIRQRNHSGTYPNLSAYSTVGTHLYRGLTTTVTENYTDTISTYTDRLGRRTKYQSPDSGEWNYSYDVDNNLKTQTDPQNRVINFTYDKLNRILTRTSADTSINATYTYDQAGHGAGAVGHLTSTTYNLGSDSYSYDARGRLSSQTRTLNSKAQTMAYSYDSADRIVTQTYPDNEVVTSTYGADGNLVTLAGVLGTTTYYVNNITYKPYGKVDTITYGKGTVTGDGTTTTYFYYDAAANVDANTGLAYSYHVRRIVAGASFSVLNLGFSYEKNGNLHSKDTYNTTTYSETYGYDELDRLTSANSSATNLSFGYDPQDNITSKDGLTNNYQTKPHAIVSNQTYTFGYDPNGNMTSRSDGRVIGYDYENRVTSVSNAGGGTYSYDTGRQRTLATVGTKTTYYYFPEYQEEWTSGTKTNTLKYYSANNQKVAQNTSAGFSYVFSDHLGSSTTLTNANGNITGTQGYQPYGTNAFSTGNASSIKYQFTGQENDVDGLYYYNARYYDPSLGRFIQPDPATYSGEVSVKLSMEERMNPYLYAMNNPERYTDPSGTDVGLATIEATNAWESGPKAGWLLAATAIVTAGAFIDGLTDNAISNSINNATNSAGSWIMSFFATKSDAKPLASTQTQERESDSNRIRIQLQTGKATPASSIKTNTETTGVTKVQGYEALMEIYTKTAATNPGLAKSKEFQTAIIDMSQAIKSTVGVSGGGNVMRETFTYNGTDYRIDLENLSGTNLVE